VKIYNVFSVFPDSPVSMFFALFLKLKAGQNRTKQDKTGQNRTKQDKTGQNRTKQDKTGQNRTK
jgi:hypothetical protein